MAGLHAARSRGRKGGRKPKDTSKIEAAIQLYNKRELTVEQICKAKQLFGRKCKSLVQNSPIFTQ
jgi:DNA invertase Pin-like site-specific DNA recombinase